MFSIRVFQKRRLLIGGILSNNGCFFIPFLQDFSYKRGDYLLFGSETSGLPPEALEDCKTRHLVEELYEFQWLKLMLDASISR